MKDNFIKNAKAITDSNNVNPFFIYLATLSPPS